MLNRELEDAKNRAEIKTSEYVALVDERECLAPELENAEEDIRKLRSRVKTELTSRRVIQRSLEAKNLQSRSVDHPFYTSSCSCLRGQQPSQF